MNIVIRTDASLEIGTGHVMRCITLAKQLKSEEINIIFICRNLIGNCIKLIENEGFTVRILKKNDACNQWNWLQKNWKLDAAETKLILAALNKRVDLLIVDHYGLDEKWESDLRSAVKKILVIDDLANRAHDCDVLLDQNYYPTMNSRYNNKISHSCIQLLGPNYALLRDEFLFIKEKRVKSDGVIQNVLVFFGGSDQTGETIKTLQAVEELNLSDVQFNVVVGAANPKKEKIRKFCEQMTNVTFYCQVNNMAELMQKADFAIGAGGTTTWERCFLGLPSIVIVVADNQQELAESVAKKGAICCLGRNENVTAKDIAEKLYQFYKNPLKVSEMIRICSDMMQSELVKDKLVNKNIMELIK
ncbi:UDP-2,4-diacetamido-2,4,6-trideoxy-beta-L-altropyranose hydrolase [Niallia nealsonii]|uniref:UDP-2,4-diacetamido-2,4, 6-trideoxy-beta-L-altropyranose hydrolase n=1 Tax=Niallia nealsonii TaxID=115979 RepID=A0A2N0YZT2_9BACI|nr:UDP-2,4-diacetamido-2,4,6-trideoxy-beta-L-altropyranose hydrolase [Niallia nealsonii]PKG22768.1 UDP-2,4-diacetamido-2,4,6-trideoxy-beta-L-altropyranose hydrolase [Niallia nealsonii]